jgi:glycosyltransferase involved in cell wall biosynthesis
MNISVVIPAYNERGNIARTIEELKSVLGNIADVAGIQIIVVDDHSSDDTFEEVFRMGDPRVTCIRLSRRSGSHKCIRAGLRESVGDAVLCISADGQDDPSCLADMLGKWRNGSNIVWALRNNRNSESLSVQLPAKIFYKTLLRLTGSEQTQVDLSRADFYLLDRSVVEAINSCPEKNTSLFGLIAWLGFKQDYVNYERRERFSGSSKWSFKSRLQLAKDWIVAFSGLPLRVASSLGFMSAIVGVIYAVIVVINRLLFNITIKGFATTVILILVLGGIQLTILGIIGEYLWRNLEESRNRPLYFIEKRIGNSEDK